MFGEPPRTSSSNRIRQGALLLLALAWALTTPAGFAKSALVIGNGNYGSAPLTNPVNDAVDMADKLRALEFDVNILTNASRRDMRRAIREYSEQLRVAGGVGLFYYAGHGMQIKGVNYLIPTDAVMQSEFEIPDEAVSANSVLRALEEAGNDLNIVILDACRDNPFAKSYRSASTRGLARMDAPGGSIIAYATAPGNTAMDGQGRNGVYTKHLLANLDKPGMPIEQMFKKVRIGVIDESGGQQTPWEESSLRADFYFAPAKVMEVALPTNRLATQTVNSASVTNESSETIVTRPAPEASGGSLSPVATRRDPDTDALLESAYAAMRDYRLTSPERHNALYYYKEVLKRDPVNFDAHSGLQSITRRYISLAEQEIRDSDIQRAEMFIARGMEIHPDNPRLNELERELEELRILQAMLEAREENRLSVATPAVSDSDSVDDTALLSTAAPSFEAAGADDAATESVVLLESPGKNSSDVAETDVRNQSVDSHSPSRTGKMKQEFKREVGEFKSSILGFGKTIKSGFGGLLAKKNNRADTTR